MRLPRLPNSGGAGDGITRTKDVEMSNILMVTYFAMKITMTSSLMTGHFDVICDLLLNRRTTTWNLLKAVEGINH